MKTKKILPELYERIERIIPEKYERIDETTQYYHYQLREDFFNNSDTLDFQERYNIIGLFYLIKINTTLLNHYGIMKINWKRFSNNRKHKNLIEDIILNSGWFIVNEDENTFYSLEVNRQLERKYNYDTGL